LTSRRKPRLCSVALRAGEIGPWRGIAAVRAPKACRPRSITCEVRVHEFKWEAPLEARLRMVA